MKKRAFRVGIYDSGVGGLTVLHECVARIPHAKYYYYGDNARAPYGNRSEEEILAFAEEAFHCFLKIGVDAVVIACNTVTAAAVNELRRRYPFPVIGMEPAVKPAAQQCKKVLVLATKRTAESARMQMLVKRFPSCDITLVACPYLALAIERCITEGESFLLASHLPQGKFDGVVLGCTHYSFFARQISKYYSAPVFDGNQGTARRLEFVLNSIEVGTADHRFVQNINKNPNNCFSLKQRKCIKFVGKSRKINKNAYFRTFVSAKTKKK